MQRNLRENTVKSDPWTKDTTLTLKAPGLLFGFCSKFTLNRCSCLLNYIDALILHFCIVIELQQFSDRELVFLFYFAKKKGRKKKKQKKKNVLFRKNLISQRSCLWTVLYNEGNSQIVFLLTPLLNVSSE